MKGRSQHRLPISDPPDDWGDGSWTVDCVCGVTFDDGEEMVNCDECGVWVHTRCSRFVKGEQSFACDKCKGKKSRNDNSEETEVAQLLVELPTKTMRMDGRSPVPPQPSIPPRPFKRLWTDIPIEERVHVQGVPGDPMVLRGLSSVFTSELWKCTGYVPKKFNFRYKEFPCWEDEDVDGEKQRRDDSRAEEENENPVDRGADVLFSLSKNIMPYAPQLETIGGLRGAIDGVGCARKPSPKEMKKVDWRKGGLSSWRMQSSVKKERNQLRPITVHLGKRKKEDTGISKERSGKKKSRSVDKEVANKKKGSTLASDARKVDSHEDRDIMVGISSDYQDMQSEDRRGTILAEPNCDGHQEASINDTETKSTAFAKAFVGGSCDGGHERNSSLVTLIKVENIDQQASIKNGISPRADAPKMSMETNVTARVSVKEEDVSTPIDGSKTSNHLKNESHDMGNLTGDSSGIVMDSNKSKLPNGDQRSTAQDVCSNFMLPDSNGIASLSSVQTSAKIKIELDDRQASGSSEFISSAADGKLDLISNSPQHFAKSDEQISEDLEVHDTGNLQSAEHISQDSLRPMESARHCDTNTITEGPTSISDDLHCCEQESAGQLTVQESDLKPMHTEYIEDASKLGGSNPSLPAPSLRKLVVGMGKSSSSSTIVFSKSSVSGSYKAIGTSASSTASVKPTPVSKQRVKVKSSTERKKETAVLDALKDESTQEVPRAPVKDRPKSPAKFSSKSSHGSRTSNSSSLKHTLSDTKEQVPCPSKSSVIQNVATISGSGEVSGQSQAEVASQNKSATPSSIQKSEKINQSSSQLSSKVLSSQSPLMHPPVPVNTAALSDEELALLLHQELNSSPRVPRVPRVRQTGCMGQLSSPTATSMLAKRTSSSGGKDHIMVSRRKNKEDACKDNTRNAHELTDETKRLNLLSSSPDHRRQESVLATDGLTKKDSGNKSPDAIASNKKSILLTPITFSNSGPSSSAEANDQTLSSIRSSPRDISDDDAGGVTGSARTLPGLIDEILSKGKRMTYEELCNAVLPHWRNLRKHNGERYAYSTHSQAVLDCLRNRSEWAQLVDRGPKTNLSRKRRKLEVDSSLIESENEDAKYVPLKQIGGKIVESHREEFPKGKRNTRKRRRLQLQGRALKDVRKRQKADATSDDDFGAYSSDGGESIFSEDENVGARPGDASSSSSDETGM